MRDGLKSALMPMTAGFKLQSTESEGARDLRLYSKCSEILPLIPVSVLCHGPLTVFLQVRKQHESPKQLWLTMKLEKALMVISGTLYLCCDRQYEQDVDHHRKINRSPVFRFKEPITFLIPPLE